MTTSHRDTNGPGDVLLGGPQDPRYPVARSLQDEVREGREAREAGVVVSSGSSKLQWFIHSALEVKCGYLV